MKKICVLIPCLNEALTVGQVIKNFKKHIPSCKIFVYDNGSNDDTIAVAKKHGAEVVLVEDKGKGNVVRRMFSHQHHGDYFIMIDGDDTYDISRIKEMLKLIETKQLDMVVGSRKHLDSKAYRRGHIIGNFFFSKMVSIIFGNKIQDLFSGFRIFSRRFIKTFPLHSSGFEIEADCFQFYKNKRAVRTPSSEQVRQPIYSKGIGYWKNFEEWLTPLKEILEKHG